VDQTKSPRLAGTKLKECIELTTNFHPQALRLVGSSGWTQRQPYWQTVDIDKRMKFAGQAAA
jgi:hypothetical protein